MVNAAERLGNGQRYQWLPNPARRPLDAPIACRRGSEAAWSRSDSCFVSAMVSTCLVLRSRRSGPRTHSSFTPERYEKCPVSSSPPRFARTCSRCSRPPNCSRPPRTTSPRATRSTPRSTIRPAISRRRLLTTAPATSTTCWTASATACRSCRPPTPASPRCRAWSPTPSRLPTRCCRPRSATPPSPASRAAITGATANNLLGPGTNATVTPGPPY